MLVARADLHVRIGAEPIIVVLRTKAKSRAPTALLTGWGRVEVEALPQPVNNAGEAIQIFNLLYRRFATCQPFRQSRRASGTFTPCRMQFGDTAD